MPGVGKLVSKDASAYSYLPESVEAFPEGEEFLNIMEKCGYSECSCTGSPEALSIYTGVK